MVAAADGLSASAGAAVLARGGNAVDAAIATAAVVAVMLPHMSGLGGDLFALVHREGEEPMALNASGRAGSGADPERLRDEGHKSMPFRGDIRSVTVPGCVDGWVALHERFGRLDLDELLAPAYRYASQAFPAASELVVAARELPDVQGTEVFGGAVRAGSSLRAPGLARDLDAIRKHGRSGFYEGDFARDLIAFGGGLFSEEDLTAPHADWVDPLVLHVFGHDVWTAPPNSQGYLTLSAAWLADRLGLPSDSNDALWAHSLVEAARQASFDRGSVLHQDADGSALLAEHRLGSRMKAIDPDSAGESSGSWLEGDTTCVCAVDGERMGVSLIQSNAKSFGSHLFLPGHDFVLHNRGVGFSLQPGSPAELGPGRRPPHTLSPAVVTKPDGALRMVLGTMGGDMQPQILLQLLVRSLALKQTPGEALAAGRWVLSNGSGNGFNTWEVDGDVNVLLEDHVPTPWRDGLAERGHRVQILEALADRCGHAQVIEVAGDMLAGAADPRAVSGDAVGV